MLRDSRYVTAPGTRIRGIGLVFPLRGHIYPNSGESSGKENGK